jgi:murein DD-endopeptidase MepM/ murein hydrolase activator NlpD
MGSHRAEPGASTPPPSGSVTPTPYVGKRIARPAERGQAPVTTPAGTPYVGKRVARPATPAAVQPAAAVLSAAADLSDSGTFAFGAMDATTELPLAAARAAAGRRRATRSEPATRPLVRGLPSAPVLLGVSALALAVGGTITMSHPQLADQQTSAVRAASALTGTSSVAHSLDQRGTDLNRSADRQALQQADGDGSGSASDAFQQHDAALGQLAKRAETQAARLNDNRWVTPIPAGSYTLTAGFGQVSGLWASFHTGLDFAAPTGTPIHAVSSGTITEIGWAGSYGNRTIETLPDGTEIWYCHQSAIEVTTGETVTRDEQIGLVGATGNVTGPHVHIEVRPGGGDPVDPFPAFVVHGITP